MKKDLSKVIVALMIAGICAGAAAVVKTYVLEERMNSQEKVLQIIHDDVKDMKSYFRIRGKKK